MVAPAPRATLAPMASSAAAQPVRVFLVGVAEGVARSLARYVSGDERIALTGVAPSLALAGLLLPATTADLLLIDWSAIDGAPGGTLQALRRACPGLRVVCLADEPEPYRASAVQAGADAVISKEGLAGGLEALLPVFFPARFAAPGDRHENRMA